MQSAATKLLSATGWTGVAMIEFRVADDGTPYLMEVNGRFWGSLQLAIDCDVDFPWLLYQMTKNCPLEEPAPYVIGRRLRWLLGDLDSLLIQIRTATRARIKAQTILAFARSFADPVCRQEILRLSDPHPGIREISQWIKAMRPPKAR